MAKLSEKEHIPRQFFKEVRSGNLDAAAGYLSRMIDAHLLRYPGNEEMLTIFVSSHLIFTLDLTGYMDIIEGVPMEPFIYQEIHRFFEEYQDEPNATLTLSSHILHCISVFSEANPFASVPVVPEAMGVANPHAGIIRMICSYVDQHYSEPTLTVSALAERFSLSLSYLSRIFHEVTRVHLGEYIQMRRFQEANRLLRLTDLPISDIAEQCGFTTSTAFIRSYHAKEGITPGARRKQAKLSTKKQG